MKSLTVLIDGQEHGPFPENVLRDALFSGELEDSALARVEGGEWKPVLVALNERNVDADVLDVLREADPDTKLVCPYCQTRGSVNTRRISRQVGVSGAKIAGAIMVSPLLLLATGVQRKENATEATCSNCSSTWTL